MAAIGGTAGSSSSIRSRCAPCLRVTRQLGDNTRLRLLNLMGDQEICVCYFVEILDQPQPKISRDLAYLRNAGIVAARRDGKWMHHRIVMPPNEGAAKVLLQILQWFKE